MRIFSLLGLFFSLFVFSTTFSNTVSAEAYPKTLEYNFNCSVTSEFQEIKNSVSIRGQLLGDSDEELRGSLEIELKRPGSNSIQIALLNAMAKKKNMGALYSFEIAQPSAEVEYIRISPMLPMGNSFVVLNSEASALPENYRGGKFFSDCR